MTDCISGSGSYYVNQKQCLSVRFFSFGVDGQNTNNHIDALPIIHTQSKTMQILFRISQNL